MTARRRIEPYWYVISLVLLALAVVYVVHLLTGFMPARAAFFVFGLAIYWYAICILVGVSLGTWVVARLADRRARAIFAATVPAEVRARYFG